VSDGTETTVTCDKAWHKAAGRAPAEAVVVLTCAVCGRVYARCARCERHSQARVSMRAHMASCWGAARMRRQRTLDDIDAASSGATERES